MRITVSTAVAIVLAAMLSAAPAKADYHFGPIQNGSQCWKVSSGSRDFGYWSACPQPASAPVARTTHRTRHH